MVTKSLIVVLGLLAIVDRSLGLSCDRCISDKCDPAPSTCSFGLTKGGGCRSCCDVCAKGPGERCGGQWNRVGRCMRGLECQLQYQDWVEVCSNKSGLGEQCGGHYWGPGPCGAEGCGPSGPEGVAYGTCESGLECLQLIHDEDPISRLRPGVCTNNTQSDQTSPSLTTDAPTPDIPTTGVPTTVAPTTDLPTTGLPSKGVPTTEKPTTSEPTADIPTTAAPSSLEPTTASPTILHRLILT